MFLALCRILPIAVPLAIAFSGPVWAGNPSGKVVFTLDFSDQADGDAKPWLIANGFQFKLDAEGIYRVPIAVVISFGESKIDSGSFYIPDAPHFISLFLGEKEKSRRAYTGKYYKKGGRYFCEPCGVRPGGTVVTEFDLAEAFKFQFGQPEIPPVSSVGFQMNTEDTRGGARAFLKKVEFLGL